MSQGLVVGVETQNSGPASRAAQARAPQQYVQAPQQYYAPPPQRYAAPPPQRSSGARTAAIGYSAMAGLFPVMNPLFLPIQMTIMIIVIIMLLVRGYGFWNSVLIAWLISAVFGAVFHYTVVSGVMSVMGYGQAAAAIQ